MELKRRVWWFRIGIPDDCQPYFGRGGLHRENLQTGDIRTAMERRDEAERAFHALVRGIRAGEAVAPSTLTARDRGVAWRETVADLRRDPDSDRSDEGEESALSLGDRSQTVLDVALDKSVSYRRDHIDVQTRVEGLEIVMLPIVHAPDPSLLVWSAWPSEPRGARP